MSDNTSESKHIASLDFDISGVFPQMKEIERIVKETGLTLKQVVDSNFNIGEAINKQIQAGASAFQGTEVNVNNAVKRMGMSVKKAINTMISSGDPNAQLAQYLRQGTQKLSVSWTKDMESEFAKRIPDLKKSLSSYISWDNTGKSPGIDAFQGDLESMGLITKGMLSQADIMEDVYNRINKYRDSRNALVSGENYNDEIEALSKYRFALDETEDELRDLLNAQNLSRKPLSDFTGTNLGNLGSADLEARIAKIRETVGMEEQLKISTDAEGNIRRAIVDYTDRQGRKIRETISLTNTLNKETGEMETKVKDTNFDYIDQSLKRANDEMKTLQANFKVYSDLKKQSETKQMLPQESAIIQERLANASQEYQASLVKVAQYANQGLITEQQYIDLSTKDKALQDDILIAKEKQAQADDMKYQTIVQQFEKEQSLLQQSLRKTANNVQKDGLDEQHLANLRKIQIEVEQLGRESGVITQDELTRLNLLKKQVQEISVQVQQDKVKANLAKVREQDEKTILSIYERSAGLQKQISMSKATGGQALSKEANLIREQAEQLFEKLSTDGKITSEMREQTSELQKQLGLLETQAKVNVSDSPKVNNKGMLSEIASKAKWYVAGSAAFAGGYVAKEALRTLTDVEYKVMEITRVMNDSTLNVKSFQDELFNLSVGYGRSFDDVSEVALRFAQAGYNVKETLSMTKDSLLALNTAELDVQNSTQSMIGIMQQWGYTSTELATIIDKVNYTADNNAVTSQDLVDGMLQAGAAAKTAKISFNDTIGALVALKEASGRTGREVGNALKSIIAYTQRDKSFATFESLGIEVYADKAKGMLRPALDMLGDLSNKWKQNGEVVVDTLLKDESAAELLNENMAELIGNTEDLNAVKKAESDANDKSLSDVERLDAVQTAGMHRRTYFISLLENFNKIQQVSTDLQKADGYSMQENSKHMDTLKTKVTQLIESLKQLAVQAGNAGLLDIAKGAIDATTALTDVIENIGGLGPALMIVLGIVIALKREKIAAGILDLETNIKGLWKSFGALKTGAIGASGAIETVGIFTQAVLGWIGLATIAITTITGAITAHNKKVKEQQEALIDTGLAAESNIKSITDLKQKYDELSSVSSKTTEKEEEFKKVQKDLISLLGDKADVLKNLTDGTDAYRVALEKATAEELASQKLALIRGQEASKDKVNALSKGFLGSKKKITTAGTLSYDEKNKFSSVLDKNLGKFAQDDGYYGEKVFAMPQNDIKRQIEYYQALKKTLSEITEMSIEDKTVLDSATYELINSEILRLTPAMQEYTDVEKQFNEVNKKINDNLKEQVDTMPQIKKAIDENTETMSTANRTIDDSQVRLKELADLNDLVSQSEEVSSSQILDLIQKYPQYAAEIANVNTNKQAMIDLTAKLAESEKQATISELNRGKQKLELNYSLVKSEIDVANAKIAAMQVEALFNTSLQETIGETKKNISGLEATGSKTLSDINAINEAISTIGKLDISSYTKKGTKDNLKEQKQGAKEQKDLIKEQTDAINDQITAIEHYGEIGVYTIEKQISLYKELLHTSAVTAEIQQKLEKNIFNLYKKQIEEKKKLAEKEKDNRIQAIKDSTDVEIKALKAIQDARDNSRSEEDYQDKRKDILEKISYWEQRTGEEAVTNLLDLKKQLAELDKSHQRKREDDEIQSQIKNIEEKRDNEIKNAERTWDKLQSIFDSENLDMIDKSKVFSSSLFNEYDMNFLKPFILKIAEIKENMRQLASAEQARAEQSNRISSSPSPVYSSSQSNSETTYKSPPPKQPPKVPPSKPITMFEPNQNKWIDVSSKHTPPPKKTVRMFDPGSNKWIEYPAYKNGTTNAKGGISKVGENGEELRVLNPGDGIVPAQQTKNLMDIGQYSLNQIMDKAQFVVSSALQRQLGGAIESLQQKYSSTTSNNYSNDNKKSTVINNKIINHNHIEDQADSQALANTVLRQIMSGMRTLPV